MCLQHIVDICQTLVFVWNGLGICSEKPNVLERSIEVSFYQQTQNYSMCRQGAVVRSRYQTDCPHFPFLAWPVRLSTRPTIMRFSGGLTDMFALVTSCFVPGQCRIRTSSQVCAEAWAFQLGMQNWILEFVGRLAGNVCGISTNILSCLQSCGHSLQTIGILATLVQKTVI